MLQNAFVRIFRNLDSFDRSKPLKPWLIRITINEAFRINKRLHTTQLNSIDDIENTILSKEISIDEIINYRDLIHLIESLPFRYRIVFLMKEIEGYSHKEISEYLNIPEPTSRTILTRAKRKLQGQLIENTNDSPT